MESMDSRRHDPRSIDSSVHSSNVQTCGRSRRLMFRLYSLHIDPTFWNVLYSKKLDVWKLDDTEKAIHASVVDHDTIYLNRNSFGEQPMATGGPRHLTGIVRVFNTRNELVDYHRQNKRNILKRRDCGFVLLVHAELKSFTFDHYFALPTTYPSKVFYGRLETSLPSNEIDVKKTDFVVTEDADTLLLPWMAQNEIMKEYVMGRRVLEMDGKDGRKILHVRCDDTYKIRYRGWYNATLISVDLSEAMDPQTIGEQNRELNLKLMMWRNDPDLPLDKLRNVKCLLIGAGTVGCSVGRTLIAWGVRNITFVDCANVSHSNPVRQNLYTANDIGKEKAMVAAQTLNNILPSLKTKGSIIGHTLEIPMPGHVEGGGKPDYDELENLIRDCDVIFLSTDSREGRWLPIVMAQVHTKRVINIALGYETLLVQHITDDNGCYFCNDPVGPRDSVSTRTIDQKCTITRPGVSYIASALSVEFFVDIIRGAVKYDQIRFDLRTMTFRCNETAKNPVCPCCSIEIVSTFRAKGYTFVDEVKCEPGVIEDVSGYVADMEEVDENWEIESIVDENVSNVK